MSAQSFAPQMALDCQNSFLAGSLPPPTNSHRSVKLPWEQKKNIKWSYRPNLPDALAEFKANKCRVLALEYTPDACDLQVFQHTRPLPEQVALVVGSEPAGVDPAILQIADQVLYIPMAGEKNSLNVSVAFGIAIYRLLGL